MSDCGISGVKDPAPLGALEGTTPAGVPGGIDRKEETPNEGRVLCFKERPLQTCDS